MRKFVDDFWKTITTTTTKQRCSNTTTITAITTIKFMETQDERFKEEIIRVDSTTNVTNNHRIFVTIVSSAIGH
jgi:hypothetical protein